MLKRAITYESYDGETVTEDFYFHLSKADLAELELGKLKSGGMEASLKKIIADEDGAAIIAELKKIIAMSVGRKSPDGRRFLKNEEIREDFLSSPAYEVIFLEMVTDATKAAAFIAACIPGNIAPEDLETEAKNVFTGDQPTEAETGPMRPATPEADPTAIEPRTPQRPEEPRILTKAEAQEMPHAELSHLLATGQARLGE